MTHDVLLVGVGTMGAAYADVLKSLGTRTLAIGRSAIGAKSFMESTGVRARPGGLAGWLADGGTPPSTAIVCVPIEQTAMVVRTLLDAGAKQLLVEKPGGTTPTELRALSDYAEQRSGNVLVAYNRRFYASVAEARRRIEAEGGVDSFHFEFTERESDASGKFSSRVRHHWGLANSSHVIDLAFFLGGHPEKLSAEIAGAMPWHPSGARFVGSGRTEGGALFSYCANWTSGGRWSVELMTRESRLILRPLEKLFVQRRGSFELTEVTLDDILDVRFKPGLYRQTQAFLEGRCERDFVSLKDQAQRSRSIFASITGEGLV